MYANLNYAKELVSLISRYNQHREVCEGSGVFSMRCEFYHPRQKNCKARIWIQMLDDDENGDKQARVTKKPEETKTKKAHICGEPNASRFHVVKVSSRKN